MERIFVSSSNIRGVGYQRSSLTLEVEFNNGGVFHFLGLPPQMYIELMGSESKGKYFHSKIRGKFETKRVDDEPGEDAKGGQEP